MSVIKYLLVLLIFCSLTSQEDVASEIKKQFFSKIKSLLNKRGSFDYDNIVVTPQKITSKQLIIDRVELNAQKINEIKNRYNLETKIIEQIKNTFYQSQPNVYNDFEFSLNSADLNQILDNATFIEYIGCSFKQNNIVNYIIMRLSIIMNIKEKKIPDKKWCILPRQSCPPYYKVGDYKRLKKLCDKNIWGEICRSYLTTFNIKTCPNEFNQYIIYKRRSFNAEEKMLANKCVSAYSGDIFNVMIEEIEKKTIIPDKNLQVQSTFYTGQIFKNESYYVQAEITNYGDIEIKQTKNTGNHYLVLKKCKNDKILSFFYVWKKGCLFLPPCDERINEYLIADKDSESSCVKLKEIKEEKKNIQMEIYIDGSIAIKSNGGILFYEKPNIKGKGPFTVGVTKEFELQIIDSQNVAVWKSNTAHIHVYA